MNTLIIVKVEIKPIGSDTFTSIDIVPHSGSITEEWRRSIVGLVADVSVRFRVAQWSEANDTFLKPFRARKSIIKITCSDGSLRVVGTQAIPARMLYESSTDKSPSGFNGYDCSIDWRSPDGCVAG